MEHVNCNLCGSSDYEVLWDKTEREKPGTLRSVVIRDEQCNIIQGRNVMCKRCGLVYVSPRLTKPELDRFYAKDYRKIYGGGASLEAEKRHAGTATNILHNIFYAPSLEFASKNRRILDIGCSTGELLVSFRLMWPDCAEAYGIEPNAEYCKKAQEADLNVLNTTIEDYNPDIRFDIITMLNTLEHVFSPTAVLQKIHSLLNDGGHVLVSVPNLLSTSINIPVDAFLSNAHLFNFTAATLALMMQKCGLRPVKAYPVSEEMGEKVYMLAVKDTPHEIVYDDNTEKRIEFTKIFLEYVDRVFVLRQVLNGGIR